MKKSRYHKERIQTIVKLLKQKQYPPEKVSRIKQYIQRKIRWINKYNKQRKLVDQIVRPSTPFQPDL